MQPLAPREQVCLSELERVAKSQKGDVAAVRTMRTMHDMRHLILVLHVRAVSREGRQKSRTAAQIDPIFEEKKESADRKFDAHDNLNYASIALSCDGNRLLQEEGVVRSQQQEG